LVGIAAHAGLLRTLSREDPCRQSAHVRATVRNDGRTAGTLFGGLWTLHGDRFRCLVVPARWARCVRQASIVTLWAAGQRSGLEREVAAALALARFRILSFRQRWQRLLRSSRMVRRQSSRRCLRHVQDYRAREVKSASFAQRASISSSVQRCAPPAI